MFKYGNHTCAVKRPPQSSKKKDIKEYFRRIHRKALSCAIGLHSINGKNREDWKSGQTSIRAVKHKSGFQTEKQVTKESEPYGHNFEAVCILNNIAMQKTRFTSINK